jgi:hypothetical protein
MESPVMGKTKLALFSGLFGLAVVVAACGGGGGGGYSGGNPGGGGSPPTTSPTQSPGGTGTATNLSGGALANANVVFSCGCSAQAGTVTADGSGNYTINASNNATPSAPNPTYTMVPGRNYIVAAASGHTEAWTMLFLGSVPSHDLFIGPNSGNSSDDAASAAAALYILDKSPGNSDQSFDDWNFNTIANWVKTSLRGTPNSAESKLMNDITSMDGTTPLWPVDPAWRNDGSANNATIIDDINAVAKSGDPNLPTPCPGTGSCTNTPTP